MLYFASVNIFSSVETNYLLLYSHQYIYVSSRTEKKEALNGIRTIENIRYWVVVASHEIGMWAFVFYILFFKANVEVCNENSIVHVINKCTLKDDFWSCFTESENQLNTFEKWICTCMIFC